MGVTFIWPTNTKRITSEFGKRWGARHNGLDIADPGARPIFAVADGKVVKSYLSDSYGECIIIEHNINGQVWQSLYAHMRSGSRGYVVGQKVKQGAQIGVMGSTGHSTGQHLHFELHKGRWNINKTDAVDPLDYLEKDLSPKTSTKNKGKLIYFPPGKGNWKVYPLDKAPVAKNKKGEINPTKFDGLTYEILGEVEPHTYIIQTSDFGKVKVYGHPSTDAVIKDKPKKSGIPVKGRIKIVNVANAAYICDRPSSTATKNLATIGKGKEIDIAGSVPGWWEVIYEGKRAYVNAQYGKRID